MNYTIRISNPGNHIANPLLTLANREYTTREDACEAIYDALYDVIDGECGLENIALPNYNGMSDEEYSKAKDDYINTCHDCILHEGYASEDGVSATVEEVRQ